MPVTVHGYKACECIAASITGVEAALKAAGKIKTDLSGLIMQGAYNTTVTASAGTHSGGGVWDVTDNLGDWGALTIFRQRGWIAWRRTAAEGFTPHVHIVLNGCPHLSSSAASQIAEWQRGGDGLIGTRPDTGPNVTKVTWQQAMTPGVPPKPVVSLAAYLAARSRDLKAPDHVTSDWANVIYVERGLAAEGQMPNSAYVDGAVGTSTDAAWRSIQSWLGHKPTGIPTLQELQWLGARHGFTAVA